MGLCAVLQVDAPCDEKAFSTSGACILTDKLNEMGLSKSQDNYLETQGREMLKENV
jgi:hypothetical protein